MKRETQLLGALLGALCLHAPLLLVADHQPPARRSGHERETPVRLRMIAEGLRAPVANEAAPVQQPVQAVQPALPTTASPVSAGPASAASAQGADAGSGFDVPPVPERGWMVNLRAFNPWAGAGRAKVLIEVEVSAQGEIRRWRLLQSTLPDEMAMAILGGIQATAMLPAIRDGEPVDAIARYELSFGPP